MEVVSAPLRHRLWRSCSRAATYRSSTGTMLPEGACSSTTCRVLLARGGGEAESPSKGTAIVVYSPTCNRSSVAPLECPAGSNHDRSQYYLCKMFPVQNVMRSAQWCTTRGLRWPTALHFGCSAYALTAYRPCGMPFCSSVATIFNPESSNSCLNFLSVLVTLLSVSSKTS